MGGVSEGSGRYDNLHGDEPEIEAELEYQRRRKEEYDEDHWEDFFPPSILEEGN